MWILCAGLANHWWRDFGEDWLCSSQHFTDRVSCVWLPWLNTCSSDDWWWGSCLEKEMMQGTVPVHAGEEGHAWPGWTTGLPWKSQSEWQRTEINGESTSMVWPTLGSRMAKEQNRTVMIALLVWQIYAQARHVAAFVKNNKLNTHYHVASKSYLDKTWSVRSPENLHGFAWSYSRCFI